MAERQETVDDIIAWLRRPREGEKAYLTVWRDEIADRLEAAHRRELARVDAVIDEAVHGYPPEDINDKRESGNCAKLREALEAIISGYENADLCDMNYGEWCHDPANVCVNVQLCKAIHKARAALAAPPRNCDKFGGDYKMLHTTWFDWTGSPSGQNADGTAKLTFGKWLLAPATETEGGSDGNK